jgi:excisionase family DNA binding protein
MGSMLSVEPMFLTAAQVGAALGVSAKTVLAMLDAGELPWVHIGKRRRIPAAEFRAWCAARTADAVSVQRSRRGRILDARVRRQA